MKTFRHGGVHPPDMKDLTKDKRLEHVAAPPIVVLPVAQHTGAPSKPIVKVGNAVDKGQKIAEADGHISVPLHSPVSGKVTAIELKQNVLGRRCEHIVIESDEQTSEACGISRPRNWRVLGPDHIRSLIRDAGVVGLGGAAFPTHVKLHPPKEKKIDILIINGIECEPYLTSDHRLMIERAQEISEGIRIMRHALGGARTILGIEANKRDAYDAMTQVLSTDHDIKVELFEVKYPQGAEKQLIEALTERRVPPGRLPFDVGVIVQNVGTVYAVYEAVALGRPMIQRVITVTGEGVEHPANLIVPIGTPISYILSRQGLKPKVKKIIMGGPMMGIAVPSPDLPVTKGTSGILALVKVSNFVPGPCIRCGRCIKVCPLKGVATEWIKAIEAGDVENYGHLHIIDCMECGSCAFVCPSNRQLVHYVKRAKAEYLAWKASKARGVAK